MEQNILKTLATLQEDSRKSRPTVTKTPPKTFDDGVQQFRKLAFMAIAKGYMPRDEEFHVDDENREAIARLVKYFGHDASAQDDHNKGILILGNVGSGKSLLFEMVNFFAVKFAPFEKKFSIKCSRDARLDFMAKGVKSLLQYSEPKTRQMGPGQSELYYPSFLFDDLGAEKTEGKNFGNSAVVMSEIIQDRYKLWEKYGTLTHFNTNLIGEEIEAIYGDRTHSRLKKMCNIISLTGKDRRKK